MNPSLLKQIAQRGAKEILSSKASENSMALRLLRMWHQAEMRGVQRYEAKEPEEIKDQEARLAALRAEYQQACEMLGGIL